MARATKTPSYLDAVEWVAQEDDPVTVDVATIQGYVSVALVADLFGLQTSDVATDVHKVRVHYAKPSQK